MGYVHDLGQTARPPSHPCLMRQRHACEASPCMVDERTNFLRLLTNRMGEMRVRKRSNAPGLDGASRVTDVLRRQTTSQDDGHVHLADQRSMQAPVVRCAGCSQVHATWLVGVEQHIVSAPLGAQCWCQRIVAVHGERLHALHLWGTATACSSGRWEPLRRLPSAREDIWSHGLDETKHLGHCMLKRAGHAAAGCGDRREHILSGRIRHARRRSPCSSATRPMPSTPAATHLSASARAVRYICPFTVGDTSMDLAGYGSFPRRFWRRTLAVSGGKKAPAFFPPLHCVVRLRIL